MKKIEELVDPSGIILTKNVIDAGISKYFLYSFLEQSSFEQVGWGIYASPEAWADGLYILSLHCPQGIISHDEALYHYGLIDREPLQTTITIYTGYSTSRLVKDGIKVFTVKRELLDLGRVSAWTAFRHIIPMYNMERSICDLARNRGRFEIQDYQMAIQSYVRSRDKNLNRLMEYAKSFHVDKKIREYMEMIMIKGF